MGFIPYIIALFDGELKYKPNKNLASDTFRKKLMRCMDIFNYLI